MENLKIRVNSEEESKEAQELFFELGYKLYQSEIVEREVNWIVSFADGDLCLDKHDCTNHKQISLDELRALVSLHKNPINMDKVLNEVRSDALGLLKDKEYLRRNAGGTYSYVGTVHPDHVHDLLIEIPEGANYAYKENGIDGLTFFKDDSNITHNNGEWFEGCGVRLDYVKECEAIQVWQRHTQPEELPFEKHVKTMKSLMMPCMPKSLNDQYAEIEKVRQSTVETTLNERESKYGSFSNVAEMTQGLLFVMSQYGYDDMPDTHKESIHMIASKLARIINGDHNHKDSWHDIAGYATLIERL